MRHAFHIVYIALLLACCMAPSFLFAQDAVPAAPVAAAPAAAPAPAAANDDAAKYIAVVQAYYDAAKTYSASFSQVYQTVDGIKKESSGVVWFKKPGLMRWDYEKPESRFLISDGKYFWSWEPVYRQYCKQDLSTSQLPTALTFLSGKGRIEDDFNVSVSSVKDKRVTLELLPKQPSLAYAKILFEILMPSAKVYRVTIIDGMGNTNKITFKSPEINANLEDSSFTFTPPKDASHICQ